MLSQGVPLSGLLGGRFKAADLVEGEGLGIQYSPFRQSRFREIPAEAQFARALEAGTEE
jgi:hypothetical protein